MKDNIRAHRAACLRREKEDSCSHIARAVFLAVLVSISGCATSKEPAVPTLSIVTWNTRWLFDNDSSDLPQGEGLPFIHETAPSAADYHWKLEGVARVISSLDADIVALQEIENEKVLADVISYLAKRGLRYFGVFRNGRDTFTQQDVAFLLKREPDEVFRLDDSPEVRGPTVPSKHIVARTSLPDGSLLTVINVHLPARNVTQRQDLARSLVRFIEEEQKNRFVILLGDINTSVTPYSKIPRAETELGILEGVNKSGQSDFLLDVFWVFDIRQQTHRAHQAQYDRILVDARLRTTESPWYVSNAEIRKDLVVVGTPDRGNYNDGAYWLIDEEQRDISDHYPVYVTLRASKFAVPGVGSN